MVRATDSRDTQSFASSKRTFALGSASVESRLSRIGM